MLGASGASLTERWTQVEEVYVHLVAVPEPALLSMLALGLAALSLCKLKPS
jgi:hypothetical protein